MHLRTMTPFGGAPRYPMVVLRMLREAFRQGFSSAQPSAQWATALAFLACLLGGESFEHRTDSAQGEDCFGHSLSSPLRSSDSRDAESQWAVESIERRTADSPWSSRAP